MAIEIKLNSAGVREVLNSAAAAAMCAEFAGRVAASVRASVPADADVVVDSYHTDRAASSVTIRDARGKLWQVRNGVLTRAAAANGAEVKARG